MGISAQVLLLLAMAVLLPPGHPSFCSSMSRCNGSYTESTVLDVDLTTGRSATPPSRSGGASWFSSPRGSGKCGKQAIAKIPFPASPSNSKVCIKFDLHLEDPKGWNFLISETDADGYGGTGPASEATEVHNVNDTFFIYPNLLPGNQAYGRTIVKRAITNHITILVCDNHVEFDNYKGMQMCYHSEYLFTLSGPDTMYFGMNRVIVQRWPTARVGTGLCRAVVKTVTCLPDGEA